MERVAMPSSLRRGRRQQHVYRTREEAKADLFDHVDGFYTRTKKPSHVGGVSAEAL